MRPETPDLDRRLAALAWLGDPLRRSLYAFVAESGREVGRDEAADAAGVARAVAAFHLDRLAEAGLLDVSFRRLGDRTGPGAGRTSKLYRRAAAGLEVSVPARDYVTAGRLMARALESSTPEATGKLHDAAREEGTRLGRAARERAGGRAGRRRLLDEAVVVLRESGFAPRTESGEILLGNCPFEALARESRALVCGMNLALLQGFVAALGLTGFEAALAPAAGRCCVVLRDAKETR